MFTSSPSAAVSNAESGMLTLSVSQAPSKSVASVKFTVRSGAGKHVVLNDTNTRVEVTPLTMRGDPTGPARSASWPLVISGPSKVSLYYNRDVLATIPPEATIILRDATGNEVALACLRP
jgi:hypothetical protein